MTELALEERLLQLLHNELHIEIPSADTNILEAGLLDSMMFVDLLLSLETTFGVTVSLEELELDRFSSVRRIARFLAPKLKL